MRALGSAVACLATLLVCFVPIAQGTPANSTPHGTVDLIAEHSAIQPGHDFQVGLHFRLEQGWHIYWLNPGDSGEPPKVEWTLPPGFRAGAIEWPVPRRISDHTLIDYGYEDEVLLPVEIRPPAHLATGDADLRASVKWLVCRETCIPAHASLAVSLPVQQGSPESPSANQLLFRKASAQIPKPAPQSWKFSGALDGRDFALEIKTGRRETAATFFPFQPDQIENAAPQDARPLPDGIRLKLQRSEQLLKPIATLEGVVVFDPAHPYVIKFPIRTSKLN